VCALLAHSSSFWPLNEHGFWKMLSAALRGQYALFCGGVDAIIVFRVAFDPMNGSAA